MRFKPYMQRPRKRQAREAHLLLSIIKYLNISGWYVGKVKVKGSFTSKGNFIFDRYLMKGLPDAFAFKGDTMLAVETKIGSNTLTPDQEKFKQHFHRPPSRIYLEARSLDDVISAIS